MTFLGPDSELSARGNVLPALSRVAAGVPPDPLGGAVSAALPNIYAPPQMLPAIHPV